MSNNRPDRPSEADLPHAAGAAAPGWLRIGALLPAELRERVFEPCCYDRLARDLRAGRRWATLLAPCFALYTLLLTCGFNLPRLLRHRGRFTRLAKVLMLSAVFTVVGAFVILQFRYGYSAR